ncbi:hypothetical protein SAMN02745751_02004 [Dethiosulfatibacter aminovorans DSM 17477]|uniref:Uncharacterized protein n=1 Tax=Dethiosulfatibacter aminovorans DSM 17477 TaxID=1121476 RepID=A0A1M6HFU0_9FIRM|nr:hypothetical protein SAMN02745751_02004 [Dethiosulfatibacter aminovorans DSM 17477]
MIVWNLTIRGSLMSIIYKSFDIAELKALIFLFGIAVLVDLNVMFYEMIRNWHANCIYD